MSPKKRHGTFDSPSRQLGHEPSRSWIRAVPYCRWRSSAMRLGVHAGSRPRTAARRGHVANAIFFSSLLLAAAVLRRGRWAEKIQWLKSPEVCCLHMQQVPSHEVVVVGSRGCLLHSCHCPGETVLLRCGCGAWYPVLAAVLFQVETTVRSTRTCFVGSYPGASASSPGLSSPLGQILLH